MIKQNFIVFLKPHIFSGAMAWPLAVRAQQRLKIGLLETGGDSSFFTVPFTGKLEELGYVEEKNLVIERRLPMPLSIYNFKWIAPTPFDCWKPYLPPEWIPAWRGQMCGLRGRVWKSD